MRPLVVAEGAEAFSEALVELRGGGWRLVDGWRGAGEGVVCVGTVSSAEEAAEALLAVVAGSGVLVDGRAGRDVLDRLCDDLRALGRLDHRLERRREALTREQRELLAALADGATLGEAAARLHLSRRTADRRLAAARAALGAASTAEALSRFARSRSERGAGGR